MPDTKITDLGAQTGAALATGDHLVTVDISDTSMSATGTDKRITASELAIGLAPLLPSANGWTADPNTWTRTSNTAFTLAVDATTWLAPGTRVKWKESSTQKYGVVATSSFSAGTTTVNLIGTSDYVMAATPDSGTPSFSQSNNPNGLPAYFNYTPTITGYSANPGTSAYTWRTFGRTMQITLREGSVGTSNATTKTYSLPTNVTAVTITNQIWMMLNMVTNNGTASAGQTRVSSAATVMDIFASGTGGAWTGSGNAAVNFGTVMFEF